MKHSPFSARLGLACLFVFVAGFATAADRTWTGGGAATNASWSNAANWSDGVPATADKAIFSATATPVSLDSNRTIAGLVFGGTGYDLQAAGDFTLTSNIVSGSYSIVGNAAGTNTISHGLATGAIVGSRNWLQLSNGSNLILGAASTTTFNPTGTSTALRNITFDIGANSTLTSNGTLTLNNQSSSLDIRFIKNGAGTLALNSANTLTGFGRIGLGGGTLAIGVADALGVVDIISTNAANVMKEVLITSAGVTLANKIQFLEGGAASTHTIGGTNTSGTAIFDSGATAMDLSKGGTTAGLEATRFTAAPGGTVVFKSTIQDNNTSSVNRRGSVAKIGGGIVIFEGANTYTEGTTITEGTLLFDNATGSGAGTGNVTVATGATVGGSGGFTGTLITSGAGSVVSPGGSLGNTFTVGALDATAGATVRIDAVSDTLAITDALTGGPLVFDFSAGTEPFSFNTFYTLMTFGSIVPGTLELADLTFTGITVPDGYTPLFSLQANRLRFIVAPAGAQPPSITTGPSNQTVTEGANATLTVVHEGTPPFTYQWTLNGAPLADNDRFNGTAMATLQIIAATLNETGTYSVTVTNAQGDTSASASLTVDAAPSVPSAPVATASTEASARSFVANWNASEYAVGYVLDVSTDADFSTLISGAEPIDAGARTSWTLVNLTPDTTYYYRVRAYNSIGLSTYSGTISTLLVSNDPPQILSAPATTFTAGVRSSYSVLFIGAPAPTLTATGLPAWLTLDSTNGVLSGTAPAGTTGAFTFEITAANGNLPNASQQFTVTVAAIPNVVAGLTVSTLAGTAGSAGATEGTGAAARFRFPLGADADAAGNLYVADADNHTIRKVTSAGVVTLFAGAAGTAGTDDGTGAAARFNGPAGIAVATNGDVYVADSANHTIRKITSAGVVTTLAGSAGAAGNTDGMGSAAQFDGPQGVALNAAGDMLYVADTNNHTIREIGLADASVTTLAGAAGTPGFANAATGDQVRFYAPVDLAVVGDSVYVADLENHVIRAVNAATGETTTFAGYPQATGATDGTGTAARFNQPSALVANSTHLYVLDTNNHTVRRIDRTTAAVTTAAGLAGTSGNADGIGSAARFNAPSGIALFPSGDLAIVDTENHTLRLGRLPAAPVITAQPQSMTVDAGGTATFSVTATGLPAPTYQWRRNGANIAGATNSTYSVSTVYRTTHGGDYTVVVTNPVGAVTSAAATLTVIDAGPPAERGTGGGAPSVWFLAALTALAALRWHRRP